MSGELTEFRIEHVEDCTCTETFISGRCIQSTGTFVKWLDYYSIDGEDLEDKNDY